MNMRGLGEVARTASSGVSVSGCGVERCLESVWDHCVLLLLRSSLYMLRPRSRRRPQALSSFSLSVLVLLPIALGFSPPHHTQTLWLRSQSRTGHKHRRSRRTN